MTLTVTTASAINLRGATIAAGTEFVVTDEAIRDYRTAVRFGIGGTVSVKHPLHDGARLAVSIGYLDQASRVALLSRAFPVAVLNG